MPRTKTETDSPALRHYFVDEAGDSVLFNQKRQVIVGSDGCSRFFALGCLEVEDPKLLADDMEALRTELLRDPFLSRVPSMQPNARKTASAFHAKDDMAEVRHQVFHLLARHKLKFYGVVRDKRALVSSVRLRNERDPAYRYNENDVYDGLVARLFKDRLHKAAAHSVTFARRGKSDRTQTLRTALANARANFARQWNIDHDGPIAVTAASPREANGLQAVDYYLWALQRFYERRDDRYLAAMWPQYSLVIDLDDTRNTAYGRYYTQRNALTLDEARFQ